MGKYDLGINLAKEISSYIKTTGKGLLQTRPKGTINIEGLRYIPENVGDVIKISRKAPSVQELATLTREEGLKMLEGAKGVKSFNASRQNIELQINGNKYNGQFIGGGGSKSAYQVLINNEEACVLLPSGGWAGALYEPQNTMKLKEMGLLTNDYCKIIKANVDGIDIPALITKPYNKHSFKIFDGKNANDLLDNYINPSQINEGTLPDICSGLISDVKQLADNHIVLGSDSINLALKDGKLRLYLNDLPYEKLTDKTIPSKELAQRYLIDTLDVIQARFSWNAYESNPTLQKLGNYKFLKKFVNDLLK